MRYIGIKKAGMYTGKSYLTVFHHSEQRGKRTVEYMEVWELDQDFQFDKPKGEDIDKGFIQRASRAFGLTPTGKKKRT